eukprot:scaffold42230_cov17-Tisochrysis_lutea.AAC.1
MDAGIEMYWEGAWDFFSLQPQLLACLREALSVWTGRGGQEIFHEKAVLELFELSGQLLEEGRSHALSRDAKDPVGFFARNILERRENGTLSHEETNQLVLEMLIAGTDTSSVTLSWLPMAMQEDPSLEDALLCEVQQMLKQDGRLPPTFCSKPAVHCRCNTMRAQSCPNFPNLPTPRFSRLFAIIANTLPCRAHVGPARPLFPALDICCSKRVHALQASWPGGDQASHRQCHSPGGHPATAVGCHHLRSGGIRILRECHHQHMRIRADSDANIPMLFPLRSTASDLPPAQELQRL